MKVYAVSIPAWIACVFLNVILILGPTQVIHSRFGTQVLQGSFLKNGQSPFVPQHTSRSVKEPTSEAIWYHGIRNP